VKPVEGRIEHDAHARNVS